MGSGGAGGIHREDERLLILEIALDPVGAGVDTHHVAAFVQDIRRNGAAADVMPGLAGWQVLELARFIRIEGGEAAPRGWSGSTAPPAAR